MGLFKRINDEHGHDVGDLAIKAVADQRAGEGIAGRLGGEEFAVILPCCASRRRRMPSACGRGSRPCKSAGHVARLG
ncbi:diguanylate cyclase [Methylobacterium sp. UNC378MF]|uniref:diguanylate cyclase n=1 Tax=Methylobacterium sp. UNC378MF TaxID=1502748 RepID=UPI001FCDF46A|nr:diguanylate cyclase [Methylobacterium sp. UNC378MF]